MKAIFNYITKPQNHEKNTYLALAQSHAASAINSRTILHLINMLRTDNISTQNLSLKTNDMEQTYTWTYNVIKSCNNDFHFGCADTLIQLFSRKYGESSEMVYHLRQLRQHQWVSVHGILI